MEDLGKRVDKGVLRPERCLGESQGPTGPLRRAETEREGATQGPELPRTVQGPAPIKDERSDPWGGARLPARANKPKGSEAERAEPPDRSPRPTPSLRVKG